MLLVLLAALCAVAGGPARAASSGCVFLNQTSYTVHESQGELQITIDRTNTTGQEQIRYGVRHLDSQPGLDLDTVPNTYLVMQPGQASATFDVRIIDRGMNASPVYAMAYIYGSDPDRLCDATGRRYRHGPVNSRITILRDDPLDAKDPADLLGYDGLAPPVAQDTSAAATDPLTEAPFWIEGLRSPAGTSAHRYRHRNHGWYNSLEFLADQPGVHRFYFWNTPAYPAHTVARFLENVEAHQPNTVVQLSTYSLVHGDCGRDTSSPQFIKRYQRWIRGLAKGIGNFHVVVFLELDSLITTQCMLHKRVKLEDRLLELRDAVQTLETLPHAVVYMDAGAADAVSVERTASLLRRAGVAQAQGFFVNSTHFDWTTKEVAYGQAISSRLGGAHFVVNTGENGQGPLLPTSRKDFGNEKLCNPPGRGLGPLSVQTGDTDVDGFLWFTNPGGSAGDTRGCGRGAPPTAVFWPARAVSLVRHADFHITGPAEHLRHDGPYAAYDAAVARDRSHSRLTHFNRQH
ncbi:MAG TPA: glycoside hydrolase family 6 protein [Solirubrobacteraceae bacterium]|jgi:endoglucanase